MKKTGFILMLLVACSLASLSDLCVSSRNPTRSYHLRLSGEVVEKQGKMQAILDVELAEDSAQMSLDGAF